MNQPSQAYPPLTQHQRQLQRAEIKFQQQMNHRKYLTWAQVLKRVDPAQSYVISDGYTITVLTGAETLQSAYDQVVNDCYTRMTSVAPLDPANPPETKAYWQTYQDPETNRTMVLNHAHDLWSIEQLVTPEDPDQPQDHPDLDQALVRMVADDIVDRRQQERDHQDQDALAFARPIARQTLRLAILQNLLNQRPADHNFAILALRTEEAFDRAYNLRRIQNHGINLDDHPELKSYQTYFELDMLPPTHQQIADYIIEQLATRPDPDAPRSQQPDQPEEPEVRNLPKDTADLKGIPHLDGAGRTHWSSTTSLPSSDSKEKYRGNPEEPQPTPQEEDFSYSFTLELNENMLDKAQQALRSAGIDLNPRDNLTAIDLENPRTVRLGIEALDLALGINRFLGEVNLNPRLREDPQNWTLRELNHFLNLAAANFEYEHYNVVRAWWYESDLTWQSILDQYPQLPTRAAAGRAGNTGPPDDEAT